MHPATLEAWWPILGGLVSIQLSLVIAVWRVSRWVTTIQTRLTSLEQWRTHLDAPRPQSPVHRREWWR